MVNSGRMTETKDANRVMVGMVVMWWAVECFRILRSEKTFAVVGLWGGNGR